MSKKVVNVNFLIPIIAAAAFILLNFVTFYRSAENRVFDQFLHIKPELKENENILLLDIDDLAIAKVGMFPWSRAIMADGLIRMKEFGARYAVFDIEYTEDSPLGVNSELLNQDIPQEFAREFSTIQENITGLFQALAEGNISMEDAQDFVQQLTGLTAEARDRLLQEVNDIARDNDIYFGKAARFFGNAYFTVNMLPEEDEDVPVELKEWAKENIALENVVENDGSLENAQDIRPSIMPIISNGAGAGYPNIIIDSDGVRRRIDLMIEHEGKVFPQLAFAPLVDWLGRPDITISKDTITLKDAALPGGELSDITIPRDENGKVLINWPKKEFEESFTHLSYYYLVLHDRQEKSLLHNVSIMDEAGYLSFYQGDSNLLDAYNYAEGIKNDVLEGGDTEAVEEYRSVREFFFEELGTFLEGEAENQIQAELDRVLSQDDLPEEYREQYTQVKQDVTELFAATRDIYTNTAETRDILRENLEGSLCIIGWTGTATTDRGVNPFDETYDNVGTHASIINTIINQRFLDILPWWYSAIAAAVLAFLVFFIIRNLNPGISILVGVTFIIVIVGAAVAYFIFTGDYFQTLTPLLATLATFIALTIIKFLATAKERTFIRNAFSHYLSTDVINEIMDNPDMLALGGEKKFLTAFFTDVKGFSTISENMDPTDLVRLLNIYLTEMSDIILELKGTIDKYEGDAIISFFGAPINLEDHARRACLSAIRMRRMERELNQRVLDEKLSPQPLYTRIGINTGEMVVGNMGTAQKMDYTMMGNSVNLAARLEGVNKQYGSWTLMSETTYTEGGREFATRKLDRVRVVGIQEPVRLYELIDEWANISSEERTAIDTFHQALDIFEKREWDAASEQFQKVLDYRPEDGPAQTYIKRCDEFKKKTPPENWDGVFNLSMK